ncbi:MAG: sigma 54-interacting transcriptional regulator [Candidatus Eisenbacteria bacterium]
MDYIVADGGVPAGRTPMPAHQVGRSGEVMMELSRALRCRANVLLTGNVLAGVRFFQNAYPKEDRMILDGQRLNRMSPGALRTVLRDKPAVLFLSHVHLLERWAQLFLLDLVEKQPDQEFGGRPAIRRVISSTSEDLSRLARAGTFSTPLYLRLSTLEIHLARTGNHGPSDPCFPAGPPWRIVGTPETSAAGRGLGAVRDITLRSMINEREDSNGH